MLVYPTTSPSDTAGKFAVNADPKAVNMDKDTEVGLPPSSDSESGEGNTGFENGEGGDVIDFSTNAPAQIVDESAHPAPVALDVATEQHQHDDNLGESRTIPTIDSNTATGVADHSHLSSRVSEDSGATHNFRGNGQELDRTEGPSANTATPVSGPTSAHNEQGFDEQTPPVESVVLAQQTTNVPAVEGLPPIDLEIDVDESEALPMNLPADSSNTSGEQLGPSGQSASTGQASGDDEPAGEAAMPTPNPEGDNQDGNNADSDVKTNDGKAQPSAAAAGTSKPKDETASQDNNALPEHLSVIGNEWD